MSDVVEQLRAYGEGLEREALQRGRLVSATTRPRRPNEHRWWIGLAASLLLVTGVGGSMALRGHAKATETVMSNEPTVPPPVVVSSERPSWYDNALDHTGRVRGTVTGRMVALPGGLTGEEVVDQHGAVVGYMMGGKSALGFVDLDQARDGKYLQALDACMTTYVTRLTATPDCARRLAADGVRTDGARTSP